MGKRIVRCSLCETEFSVRDEMKNEQALEWLYNSHLVLHQIGLAEAIEKSLRVKCSRCQRYEAGAVEDALHRKCFSADCDCDCSYPVKEEAE